MGSDSRFSFSFLICTSDSLPHVILLRTGPIPCTDTDSHTPSLVIYSDKILKLLIHHFAHTATSISFLIEVTLVYNIISLMCTLYLDFCAHYSMFTSIFQIAFCPFLCGSNRLWVNSYSK